MILYLSAAIPDEYFAQYLKNGIINGGHQAQKFNSMIIRGVGKFEEVRVISNPPYCKKTEACSDYSLTIDNCFYSWTKNTKGKIRKISNYLQMSQYIRKCGFCDGIICDAINPLASLLAIKTAKRNNIPAIAIVTDIPKYMDLGRESIFTKITEKLLSKYDGYVFLTEAMNSIVNHENKPYIVVEGLCDDDQICSQCKKYEMFTCMYAGSLSHGNGISEFIDGFIQAKLPNSQLLIYGNGPCVEEIKDISRKNDVVKYCGVVTNKEIVEIQKKVTLLINPRPVDIAYANVSFPSKVIEYMASGTPLLTTHLPGIPDEYFEFVFESECTVSGFSKALTKLYSLPKDELNKKGKEAQEFVVNTKNKELQAARILKLMKSLNKS